MKKVFMNVCTKTSTSKVEIHAIPLAANTVEHRLQAFMSACLQQGAMVSAVRGEATTIVPVCWRAWCPICERSTMIRRSDSGRLFWACR
eukprot:1615367-Prorocentrum_lima.AAC.1